MGFGEAKTLGFNNQAVNKLTAGLVTLDKTGLTVKNSFGAVIYKVEPSKDAWFLYADTGSATQGRLIASSASANGTDDFGNGFVAGSAAYIVIAGGTFPGTYAITLADQAYGLTNVAALSFKNQGNVANIIPGVTSQSGAGGAEVSLYSGRGTAAASAAELDAWDSLGAVGRTLIGVAGSLLSLNAAGEIDLNAVAVAMNGYLAMATQGVLPAAINNYSLTAIDSSGFPVFQADKLSGDSVIYNTGHKSIASASDQLVNSTTFANICGGSWAVGANLTYDVHAELTCTQGPNAAANRYRLGFTGTISNVRMKMVDTQDNVSNFVATTTSNNGLLAVHAFGAATTYVVTIDGRITTTSTGTLSFQAAMDAAGNTFTVLALSHARLEPVT